MLKRLSIIGGALLVANLAGCGGGGGGTADAGGGTQSSNTPSAKGLWVGTTATNRTVTGVVLGDGTYYVIYSSAAQPTVIAGVVQGTGAVNGSTFTSTNGRDFNLEGAGVLPANISATVTTKQALSGSVVYAGSSTAFSGTYDSNFEVTPTLAAVAGSYSGTVTTSLGYESASVSVSSSGVVAGISQSGCSVSGTVTPRTDGNVYDFALTFGGSPCYFAGQTFNGISYYNASAKRLYSAAPNASRTDGVLFLGVKP